MAEVRSNIQKLHARFEELQKSVNIAFVHNRVPVSHIVRELSMLRASVAELENYFFEDVRELGKCVKYPSLILSSQSSLTPSSILECQCTLECRDRTCPLLPDLYT